MTKISVAIATRNEEKNIRECLSHLDWVDEIVIFDQKSTDRTSSIAKSFTKKIYFTDYNPMFHETKQMAIDRCKGDWILSLDADEFVTEELEKEIIAATNSPSTYSGYQMPRRSSIFGKWMEHTGWYPDYQIKLFKNGKGHYPCETVHELVKVDGEVGTLKSELVHNHYTSVEQFVDRMNRYTTNDAQYLSHKGEKVNWNDAVKFPVDEFIKRFFSWEGYKDGLHGLVLSLLMAAYRLIVFAKLWELQGFVQKDLTFQELAQVSKETTRNLKYWIATAQFNQESGFLQRVLLRVKRKFPVL